MGGIVTKVRSKTTSVMPDVPTDDTSIAIENRDAAPVGPVLVAIPLATAPPTTICNDISSVSNNHVATTSNVNAELPVRAVDINVDGGPTSSGGTAAGSSVLTPIPTPSAQPGLQDHVEHSTGLVYRDQVVSSSNFFASVKQGNLESVHKMLHVHSDGDKQETVAVELVASLGMWSSTPLIVACQYNHRDLALLLLERSSAATAAHRNEKGASALLYACLESGLSEVVRGLVAMLASDPVTASDTSCWLNTPLASIYHPKYDKSLRLCPLSAVILSNNVESVATILDHYPFTAEAPVRFDTPFGKGMLVISGLSSSGSGDKPVAGASRTVGSKGLTPVMLACAYGSVEVLRALLKHRTAAGVATASLAGHFSMHRDELGFSALHHLCRSTCGDETTLLAAFDLLLADTVSNDMGSDRRNQLLTSMVNAVDVEGNSALHYACDSKLLLLTQRLLDLKASSCTDVDVSTLEPERGLRLCDINIQNVNGATPLYVAIKRRCEPIVTALLQPVEGAEGGFGNDENSVAVRSPAILVGANPTLADHNGVSCLALAKKLRPDSRIYKEVVAAASMKPSATEVLDGDGALPVSVSSVSVISSVVEGDTKENRLSAATAVNAALEATQSVSSSLKLDNKLVIPSFSKATPDGVMPITVPTAPSTKNTSFNRHGSKSRLQAQAQSMVSSVDDCLGLPSLSRKNSAAVVLPTITDIGPTPAVAQLPQIADLQSDRDNNVTMNHDGLVITDL